MNCGGEVLVKNRVYSEETSLMVVLYKYNKLENSNNRINLHIFITITNL